MSEYNGEERRKAALLEKEKIDRIEHKLDEIHKILVGNGKMGICSKVNILWGSCLFIFLGICVKVGALLWDMLLN